MFQIIGESLQLKVLRSTKVHVLYFQVNVEINLSTFLLFAERKIWKKNSFDYLLRIVLAKLSA